MKDKIIEATGIQKTFANNGEQVHVLSGLDIDIYKGDFTVIMGSSGSGVGVGSGVGSFHVMITGERP